MPDMYVLDDHHKFPFHLYIDYSIDVTPLIVIKMTVDYVLK